MLNYACEFVNLYALSMVSPILLSPLGIISVMVNMFLGNKLLGEKMGFNEKIGYGIILCGVLIFIFSAQFLGLIIDIEGFMVTKKFARGILALIAVEMVLIWSVSKRRIPSKVQLVSVCSLIGAITMVLAKIITTELGSSNPHSFGTIMLLTFFATIAVMFTIVQEYFKQQAMKLFDISSLVPEMYLGYNVAIITSCGYFFQQFNFEFLAGACISLSLVVLGIRIIKNGAI